MRVSGTIFQFTSVNAGTVRLERLRRGDGSRRPRNIRTTILPDTLGDSTGGVELAVLSEVTHGPHPFFDLTEEQYCALTGSPSADTAGTVTGSSSGPSRGPLGAALGTPGQAAPPPEATPILERA